MLACHLSESGAASLTAWTTVGLLLTALFAVGFAWKQIDEGKRLARVQHLLALWLQFHQSPLENARVKVATAMLSGKSDCHELYNVLNFFELIGLLVQRGYLSAEDVWEMFGVWIFAYFQASSASREEQSRKADPNSYTKLDALHRKIKIIEMRNHGTSFQLGSESLREFWKSEAPIDENLQTSPELS